MLCYILYKIADISRKTYKTNGEEIIVDNKEIKWLNEKHIEETLDYEKLPFIIRKYPLIYK